MGLFSTDSFYVFIKLLIALFLGGSIGIERGAAGKTAGMRTYALVSMGAALFSIISVVMSEKYIGNSNVDPLRMVSQVIVGIGFISAGLIIQKDDKLLGLTTAAGLWVSTGIGIAVGYGLYDIAIFATLLTFFIFVFMSPVQTYFKDKNGRKKRK